MADEADKSEEKKPKSPMLINILVSSVLGFTCGGLGFALFTFLPGQTEESAAEEVVELPPAFVQFGEVVANIAEGRMSRYLRLNITLQIRGEDEEVVTADVETRGAVMKNWLLGYLSNLQLEDIRGAVGQNRIRREIQNHFNDILSETGQDIVQDVLFEEFTVQ